MEGSGSRERLDRADSGRMRMRSPSQNPRNPFMLGLPRPQSRYVHPAPVRSSIRFSSQAVHTTAPVPQQPFPKRLGAAELGRKEAGPGAPRVKPPRPGTQEPAIGPHPIPAQPLRGLLVHSRVHARVTDCRSWCLCRRCRRRHPAAATPGVGGWVTLPAGRGEGGDSGVDRGLAGSGSAALPGSQRLVLTSAPPGGPGCRGCLVASIAGGRLTLFS